MNAQTAVKIVRLVAEEAPPIIAALRVLFSKGDPTPADWDEFERYANKSYDDYIAEAKGIVQTPPPTGR